MQKLILFLLYCNITYNISHVDCALPVFAYCSMCARKDIRSLTYPNLASQSEFSSNKWQPPCDDVFNKLGEMVKEKEQEMISDFLNLFYYFIVCYSKKCFKKHGVWQPSKYKSKYTTLPDEVIRFNYKLANENDSHVKILEIQRRMNQYRHEFKYSVDNDKLYFNNDKTQEIKLFIEESIEIICTDIQEPVILTSYDIKSKIAKYTKDFTERKKHKTSSKLNYSVLAGLGIDIGIEIDIAG